MLKTVALTAALAAALIATNRLLTSVWAQGCAVFVLSAGYALILTRTGRRRR